MTKPRSGHLSTISVSEISAQLAGRAEALCHELLPAGHREGVEWRCGSVEGEPGQSLGVHLTGAKAGIWSDFAGGEGGDLLDLVRAVTGLDTAGAIRWAKSWLGIGDVERPTPALRRRPQRSQPSSEPSPNQDYALAIWRASRDPIGTLTGAYLSHRRITIAPPATIRDHRGLKHRETGQNLPAMVAAITGPDRKVVAIQRTFLRMDGRGKANVSEPKMTLGSMGAGAVRLGPAGPILGIAEGVETGLSAMQLFDVPTWCSLSASRLDRLWLPTEAVEIHIFGDNSTPGHEAAERAAETYQAQGHRVVLRFPPERFGDFNDLLREEVAA